MGRLADPAQTIATVGRNAPGQSRRSDDARRILLRQSGTSAAAAGCAPLLTPDRFDVDVIDFYDLPVADVPLYNKGLTMAEAMTALSEFVTHPGFAGMTFAEFNPDHGEPDGSTARTLAEALATALWPLAQR